MIDERIETAGSRFGAATATDVTALRRRLAGHIAQSFAGTGAVVAALPGDGQDAEMLRLIAAKLVAAGRDAILAAPDEAGTTVCLIRAPGSTLDCGALWKLLAARYGGRGGGKPDQAQGRLAANVAEWSTVIAELLP